MIAIASLRAGVASLVARTGAVRGETRALVLLLAFALANRLLVLNMPFNNGDALRKWMWARVIRAGWSPASSLWEGWDHHAARLSINVPTLAVQAVFGDHPVVYYVSPLLAHLVAVACTFHLGRRLGGLGVGVVAAGLWTWVVPSYWSTQLMPAAFSPAYALLTVVCLLEVTRRDTARQRWLWVVLASTSMMLAELTKVTNLFFLPGLACALYASTRSVRLTLGFGGIVALMMFGELLAYRLSSLDAPWGRASVIVANHLHGNAAHKFKAVDGVWGLITRQADSFSRTMPGLYLWLFLPVGAVGLWRFRRLEPAARFVVAAAVSYLFFHVFAIRSLDPMLSVQPPGARYLAVLLPLCILALTWTAARAIQAAPPPEWRRRAGWLAVGVGLVLLGHGALARGFEWKKHPLPLLARYDRMFDEAYREGTPILTLERRRYALHGAFCLFWDDFSGPYHAKRQRVPAPGSARFPARRVRGKKKPIPGKKFRYVYDPERKGELEGYRLVRTWKGKDALVIRHQGRRLSMARRKFDDLHRKR